ncbi:hypothetical protein RchiOBHm_Chr5g0059391 [Rosa chinensis]|uniref:Uncharacterized protein n=1 Tax=Rosa chinensis TaxID=74649 RepID=A0A2P6QHE8_ROSCH|nr:hypothetical protein RchiOBHm_Chr5g0059391 [Rosa chinensis]
MAAAPRDIRCHGCRCRRRREWEMIRGLGWDLRLDRFPVGLRRCRPLMSSQLCTTPVNLGLSGWFGFLGLFAIFDQIEFR